MALTKYKLGDLIEPCDERNYEGTYTLDDIRGISTGKAQYFSDFLYSSLFS